VSKSETKWIFINGAWHKASERPEVIKPEPKRPRKAKKPKPEVQKQCGTCRYIKYTGINQVRMEWGDCKKYHLTNRIRIRPADEPCEMWRERSKQMITRDQLLAAKVMDELKKIKTPRRK
jgi:hypothetical protein